MNKSINDSEGRIMDINVMKARQGDSIWIRSWKGEESPKNILIDAGTTTFYPRLIKLQKELQKKNEKIDLLVITHIDDDHVGGLGKLYYYGKMVPSMYDRIWINIGKDYAIGISGSQYSVSKGRLLINSLIDEGINIITKVITGEKIVLGKMEITVISPTDEMHKIMSAKWGEIPSSSTYSAASDRSHDIDILNESDSYERDGNFQNRGSITLMIKYNHEKYLFLGDADSDAILDGAEVIIGNHKSKVELIKLPHHGSSKNTSLNLLERFNTSRYIASTNGSCGKPHKKTITRLLKSAEGNPIEIFSNYNWFNNGKFTRNDKEKYIDTKLLRLIQLDSNKISIGNGVYIYND